MHLNWLQEINCTCEEWGNQRGGRITGTKICRVTKFDFSKNLTL
jgi:hypothetical protein